MQRRGDSEPAGEPLLALPSRRTNPERLIVLLRLVVKGLQWRKPGNSQPSSRQMLQDTGSLPPPTGADACEAARAPHDLIAPTIAVPVKRAGFESMQSALAAARLGSKFLFWPHFQSHNPCGVGY